jgi:hypothetical protein
MEHIVDAHVYLKDMGQMDNMNTVFKEDFPRHPPVRTTVQAYMDNLVQGQATQSSNIRLPCLAAWRETCSEGEVTGGH